MAFTYTKNSTADRDRLRRRIGDTDINRVLFEDDELDDMLVEEVSLNGATAAAYEALMAKSARDFDFSADGSSFSKSSVFQNYMKLAKRWRARARGTTVTVPRRIDGWSDDIDSDEVDVIRTAGFDGPGLES